MSGCRVVVEVGGKEFIVGMGSGFFHASFIDPICVWSVGDLLPVVPQATSLGHP